MTLTFGFVMCFYSTFYVLYSHSLTLCTQWKSRSAFTNWNWDDEHRLSRITAKIQDLKHYKVIRELTNGVRDYIFNSSISKQKYKKVLNQLNQKLLTFSKDIAIRFNSILGLLGQIIKDYSIVFMFLEISYERSAECQQYPARCAKYQRQLQAYEAAKKRAKQRAKAAVPRTAVRSNQQEVAQLLQGAKPAQVQLSPPKQPKLPTEWKLCGGFRDLRLLLCMALLYDYINLFDEKAKKTGSVKWIKCLTEHELTQIELTLKRWAKQTERQPLSPMFSKICAALKMEGVL